MNRFSHSGSESIIFAFLLCSTYNLFQFRFECSSVNLAFMTASVKFNKKNAPMKTMGIKKNIAPQLKVSTIMYMVTDHPSKVTT